MRKNWPSSSPTSVRKSKLKMRFLGKLDAEIERTKEKLELLYQIKVEQDQAIQKRLKEINEPKPPKQEIKPIRYNSWGRELTFGE